MATILPQQIPPQGTPFDMKGDTYVALDWYLFFYNLALQTLSGQGGSSVPTSQADIIDMVDLDADGTDTAVLPRRIVNAQALLPDVDVGPSIQQVTNALVLASDGLLPDPEPQAQPAQSVTVGASPFTYTATANGCAFVSGGTVSAISITRHGTAVATGVTAGPVPLRWMDQMTVTYSAAPTVAFLPD